MKTDLVLVSHNSRDDLMRFLPSIKENTEDVLFTIIDNGSAEETKKYLQDSGRFVIFRENKGYGTACNIGARAGISEFIVFLNCDLLARENWLTDLLKPFADPSVAITGARLFAPDGHEYPTPLSGWACGACFAVRRKVFEELGGFDENFFLFFEETDFCERAKKAGYKVIRSEAQLTHYHPHFPPFPPELQKHWDKSEAYFKTKHPELFKKPSLALVMIVKNEEKGLERAVVSALDFVDEIVIAIDNATTDNTEKIAQKFPAIIKHFDWRDDFSAARNFAHEGVKSDWILFLDGHEYVEKCPDLVQHLALDADGLLCTVEMENGMQFRSTRIYKNGVQFQGKIHELPQLKNVKPYTEFLVKHDRVGGQDIPAAFGRAAQRDDQVFRIMNEQLKRDPKNLHASFHLGSYFAGIGQYKKAIKYYNRYLRHSKNRSQRWYIFFNRALCHLSLGHLFRAFWSANRAEDETPGRWEIPKLKGMILFQKKKWFPAAEEFVASFHINTGDQTYKPWKRDDSGTWNLIGECFFNLGNYFKAHVAFKRAAETCADEKFKELLNSRQKLMFEMA